MGYIIVTLLVWNVIGAVVMLALTCILSGSGYVENILSPVWIYDELELNYFGVGLVCILFNLLCPVWSTCVWGFKLLKFICTVGRR